jgi:predicted ribosome quality control (RQC) complex YloA/Tae2 family protein
MTRGERLLTRLENDRARLSEYDRYRRWGELLLGQLTTAERSVGGFVVIDFYDQEQRKIEIPAEQNQSPKEAASHYFELYRKGQRGVEAVQRQMEKTQGEMVRWRTLIQLVESAPSTEALERLAQQILGRSVKRTPRGLEKTVAAKISGVFRFLSSDHHEILVGRSAEDNDKVTFKLARPHDLWLHAADYPGSHVIVRLSKKEVVSHPTLVEAAELAAYFSQARQSSKVVIHYALRKHVYKIRGAAPGLVRLADFKSLTVAPRIRTERADE